MKLIKIIALIILIYTLNSCDTFDSNKHLTGRYYLQHNKFGKSICYRVDDDGGSVELINGDFGPIGLDNNYIIVKLSEDEYLIVTIYKKMNYFPEKGILGPFKLNDFNKQKQRLNIRADFTINTD